MKFCPQCGATLSAAVPERKAASAPPRASRTAAPRRTRAHSLRAELWPATPFLALLVLIGAAGGRAAHAGTPLRSTIVDRNGVMLATTIETPSVFANPHHVSDAGAVAAALAVCLPGSDPNELRTRLAADRSFVWIARHVGAGAAASVMRLGLPGIGLRTEPQRHYPLASLASHAVGFTDGEAQWGMAGIEGALDERLRRGGDPVQLAIDARVQAAVREELAKAVDRFGAKGAAGLVLDAESAEVLALVSLPDFDPNDRRTIVPNGYKNSVTSNVYELGGVFEIFTTALALDAGKVGPSTSFAVTPTLRIGARTVHDEDPVSRRLTVADIFARSSLIGEALIAQRLSPEEQQAGLRRMGLLDPMRIELAETVGNALASHSAWGRYVRTTIGYGYGIAVTPLQAAAVATAVINHGRLVQPTLLKREGSSIDSRRIVSEATSAQMRRLLRQAVSAGTGIYADVPGYRVGGKTGTALKTVGWGYDKAREQTWFFAGFPMADTPRYTLLIMLDEPRGDSDPRGRATAQWNAAPAAGKIIARIAPLLEVMPVTAELAQAAP
jgi:cell division protein FtsI (penicillin-binding protein 3)